MFHIKAKIVLAVCLVLSTITECKIYKRFCSIPFTPPTLGYGKICDKSSPEFINGPYVCNPGLICRFKTYERGSQETTKYCLDKIGCNLSNDCNFQKYDNYQRDNVPYDVYKKPTFKGQDVYPRIRGYGDCYDNALGSGAPSAPIEQALTSAAPEPTNQDLSLNQPLTQDVKCDEPATS